MPAFDQFDVVSVPFPYIDRAARERRPALVISKPILQSSFGLLWVLMITAVENRRWQHDVTIPDHGAVGLPIPSIIRPSKVATVEAGRAKLLGKLPPEIAAAISAVVSALVL
jgi:mRNA interferase MazF